jgi:hypothetical protein
MKKKTKKTQLETDCGGKGCQGGCGGCDNNPGDPNDLANLNSPFNRLILALGDIGWTCAIPKDGWASKPGEIGGLIVGSEEYVNKVLHCIEVADKLEPKPSLLQRIKARILNTVYGW